MKRVTRRIGESIDFVDGQGYANLSHEKSVRLLFERLAEYEDIGLSAKEIYKVIKEGVPEWIPKYLEYRDLEDSGKLIRLPCKAGDIVYEANIGRGIVSTYRVTSVIVMEHSRNYRWELLDGIYSNMNGFNEYALGETVFVAKDDAEKILKERMGSKSCASCEYWLKKYQECEHPEQLREEAEAYMSPPSKCCNLYEPSKE